MDPLTIVTSVAATSRVLATLSRTLTRFIRDTKRVDNTVDALLREVNSLKRTVTAIEGVIEQPATQAVIQHDLECNLGNSVDDSLVECRTTLESLDKILEGIKVKNPGRNPFGQAVKQIKVNWNSDEFRTLRGQMHSHCLSMQLALQTITVYVTSYIVSIILMDSQSYSHQRTWHCGRKPWSKIRQAERGACETGCECITAKRRQERSSTGIRTNECYGKLEGIRK
jgi:hypothetical protein